MRRQHVLYGFHPCGGGVHQIVSSRAVDVQIDVARRENTRFVVFNPRCEWDFKLLTRANCLNFSIADDEQGIGHQFSGRDQRRSSESKQHRSIVEEVRQHTDAHGTHPTKNCWQRSERIRSEYDAGRARWQDQAGEVLSSEVKTKSMLSFLRRGRRPLPRIIPGCALVGRRSLLEAGAAAGFGFVVSI